MRFLTAPELPLAILLSTTLSLTTLFAHPAMANSAGTMKTGSSNQNGAMPQHIFRLDKLSKEDEFYI
jgi:hypothetical protein